MNSDLLLYLYFNAQKTNVYSFCHIHRNIYSNDPKHATPLVAWHWPGQKTEDSIIFYQKGKKGGFAQTFKKNEASPINKLLANSEVTFIKAFIKHIFLQRVLQGPPLNLIN